MKLRKYTVIENENVYKDQKVKVIPGKILGSIKYPVLLIIEENSDGIYLYRYDSTNGFIGDTLHDEYEDVIEQIEYEIGETPKKWNHLPQSSISVIKSAFEHYCLEKNLYSLKYLHEYFETSLWSYNDASNSKYGYSIDLSDLPISGELVIGLEKLADSYLDLLNEEYPPDTVITEEFKIQSENLFKKVQEELSDKYELVDMTEYNN